MQLSANDINALAQLALKAAETAAAYIQSQVKKNHDIQLKSGVENLATQVVTAIDLESQRLIMEVLKPTIEAFDLGLLTEELPDDGSRFSKAYFWCVDPLDGTLPFTERKPGYAVSIALVSQTGDPLIGVVSDPYGQNHWMAIRGSGVLKNQNSYQYIQQSNALVAHFDRSFLNSAHFEPTISALEVIQEQLGLPNLETRTGYGAVMNAISLLDTGAGCYVKWPKSTRGGGCIWDYAATRLIYEELNLAVSTAQGKNIPLNQTDVYMNPCGVVYATSHVLHQTIIERGKQIY